MAVKSIKKAALSEIRSLPSPVSQIKLTLEATCTLLGEDSVDWNTIRKLMVKDDFIPRILQFSTENIRPETLAATQKYVNNPDFDFEKVCFFCWLRGNTHQSRFS